MSALAFHYTFPMPEAADAPQVGTSLTGRARVGLRPRTDRMDRIAKGIHGNKRFSFENACAAVEEAALKAKQTGP